MSMLLRLLGFALAVALCSARTYNPLLAPLTDRPEHPRVLIANERRDRLALVAPIVAALGHEVTAREIEVEDVGPGSGSCSRAMTGQASSRTIWSIRSSARL
jgi:hypothetical protein